MCGIDAQTGKYQDLSIYSKPSSFIVLELGMTALTVISCYGSLIGTYSWRIRQRWFMCGMDAQSGKYHNLPIYSRTSSVIVLELGMTLLTIISSCGNLIGTYSWRITQMGFMCGMDAQSGKYQNLSIYSRPSSVIVLELGMTAVTVISCYGSLILTYSWRITQRWFMCGMDAQSGRYHNLSIYSRTSSVMVLELGMNLLTIISSCGNLIETYSWRI